jgi:hypothetical protein
VRIFSGSGDCPNTPQRVMCPRHWQEATDSPRPKGAVAIVPPPKSRGSFPGSGDCPNRPQRVMCPRHWHEATDSPDQKAQSPSCGLPVSCRVFQDVGQVHLPLVPWKSCISYFDTIGDDPVTLNRNRPSNGTEALPSAQSKNAVAISRHLTAQ